MEIKWLNPDAKFDRLVLAGDIGGTNTNLGLVGYKDGKFTLILETVCPSKDIDGLDAPIRETLKLAAESRADLKPSYVCISAAGPDDNCNANAGVAGRKTILNFSSRVFLIDARVAIDAISVPMMSPPNVLSTLQILSLSTSYTLTALITAIIFS